MVRMVYEDEVNARLKELCEEYRVAYGNSAGGFADELANLTKNLVGKYVLDMRAETEKDYSWKGMRIIPWEEVKQIARREGNLAGYFYLYGDDTEGMIDKDESWIDIVEHHERGGQFGEEIDTVELFLPDGKKIETPVEIDISEMGCLDELEYEMWFLIERYMSYFGIRTENDDPDWATVKEAQTAILNLLEKAGVKFKFS